MCFLNCGIPFLSNINCNSTSFYPILNKEKCDNSIYTSQYLSYTQIQCLPFNSLNLHQSLYCSPSFCLPPPPLKQFPLPPVGRWVGLGPRLSSVTRQLHLYSRPWGVHKGGKEYILALAREKTKLEMGHPRGTYRKHGAHSVHGVGSGVSF